MSARIPAQRQRKQRFSEAELTVLVEHIVDNAKILFSADQRRATQQQRKEVWAEAARKCTAVGMAVRSVKDCHKRWDDLRLRVRNLISTHRQRSSWTGGGPSSPLRLQAWEERCSSVLHLEGIHGIGEAEAGLSPPADAAISSDSDTAQQASQSAPASTQATATTQEDAAGSSAPLATLPATTDVRPTTTTDIPTFSTLAESRPVPWQPIMATQHNTEGSSTAEGAACSDNSAPQEHSETGPQGEMPTLEDLGSFHELGFSPTSLGSPMRSPTPSMAELNARMQRMADQQATLTQLVERQLEESRLQRESYSASVRRLSRSIGRFASTIVTLARHVREGNDHTSRLVEAMLVGQQANLARMPSIPDSAQSNTTTPSSSTTASPRRRSSRLTGPSGKVAQAQKRTRK
ncbi:myb-related transcription factor, partner of profilin-like [Ambystoma mexicanum]|uniref:myb-related transcription factor, partner of profilin-like n=1 Tax=Ambystoma mexicanum TaxID=8296 RepID=UPI0037E96FDC